MTTTIDSAELCCVNKSKNFCGIVFYSRVFTCVILCHDMAACVVAKVDETQSYNNCRHTVIFKCWFRGGFDMIVLLLIEVMQHIIIESSQYHTKITHFFRFTSSSDLTHNILSNRLVAHKEVHIQCEYRYRYTRLFASYHRAWGEGK